MNVMKLRCNLERFFMEKASDYGADPLEAAELLDNLDFAKLCEAIQKQARPLRGYTGFVGHKWRHDCSYQGEYHPKATLLMRVLKADEVDALENGHYDYQCEKPCLRHYMELWVGREMQLLVVSCLQNEAWDDYYNADYITQYRVVEGNRWPDEHAEINLRELAEILASKAKRPSEFNQTALYVPLRGEDGLMYEVYRVKNAGMSS